MSKDYSIKVTLDVAFNENNIQKILLRGLDKNFEYYDHILGERYKNSPLLDVRGATQKIIKARINNLEEGPCVYAVFEKNSSVHLCFYESEDGYLEFDAASFGGIRKKGHYIDFAYYIKCFLDLCDDFPVLGLRTNIYG